MGSKNGKVLSSIIAVAVMIFICIAVVFIFIPSGLGFAAVMQKIVVWTAMVILGGSMMFLFVKSKDNPNLKNGARACCGIMGALLIVIGGFNVYNCARGLLAGPQTVTSEKYDIGFSSTRGIKEYYIKTEINGQLERIRIDYPTFEHLQKYGNSLTVSYYPYINIADEVIINN